LNSLQFNVARALGPAAGGVLMRWLSPGACFLANALSYGAVLFALARMNIRGSPLARRKGNGIRTLVEGFSYLAHRRHMAFLVLLAGTMAMCGWPSQSLLPALAQRVLESDQVGYSLMLSGTGLGALAAAWFLATFGSAQHHNVIIGAGVVFASVALVGLSLAPTLLLATGCCALLGFGLILFLATSQSVVQLAAGDHIRGRVMGIWAMTLSGAIPLGNSLFGPAADWWREPAVLCIQGMVCALAALGWLVLFHFPNRPDLPADDGVSAAD